MHNLKPTPLLTISEVARELANAFGTKSVDAKKLDAMTGELDPDFRLLSSLNEKYIKNPLIKYAQIGEESAKFYSDWVGRILEEYASIVAQVQIYGLVRTEASVLLSEHYFSHWLVLFIRAFQHQFDGPSVKEWLPTNGSSMKSVIDWISDNKKAPNEKSTWEKSKKGWTKEQKDRVVIWSKNQESPQLRLISNIDSWANKAVGTPEEWLRIKNYLVAAKVIDHLRKDTVGKRIVKAAQDIIVKGEKPPSGELVKQLVDRKSLRTKPLSFMLTELEDDLSPSALKPRRRVKHLSEVLNKAKRLSKEIDIDGSLIWQIDWHEARWNVYSGNLDVAKNYYEKVFKGALYRAGGKLEIVINEALAVASFIKSPDKIFIKRLRNAQLTFGYDIQSVPNDIQKNKFITADFVEDWEVDFWRGHFENIFPKSGLFGGVSYNAEPARIGAWQVSDPENIKLDLKNPNKNLSIGDTWKKKIPQLVWFMMQEDLQAVKSLLDKKVNVNVSSDAGDTPILLSLTALEFENSTDELFWSLAEKKHDVSIVNMRTHKRRLLPLISAVESGCLAIVEKLLDMGAEPDKRGQTDLQTPLNICIKLIGIIKDKDLYWEKQKAMAITPEVIDSIQRYTNGSLGSNHKQAKATLLRNEADPRYQMILEEVMKHAQETMYKDDKLNLQEMRKIASFLIECGADANAEHSSPVKGYTPLMLAVELDEADLVYEMLCNGGDLAKKYIDNRTGEEVSCQSIAKYFKSQNVMKLFEQAIH